MLDPVWLSRAGAARRLGVDPKTAIPMLARAKVRIRMRAGYRDMYCAADVDSLASDLREKRNAK